MQSITAAFNPYRTFKAATFFSSSNRTSVVDSNDATSISDVASGPPSPVSISQRMSRQMSNSTFSNASTRVRNVRGMMVRSPSSAQIQLLEERIMCTEKALDLVEPRPYNESCDNIAEVLYGRF